MATKIFLIPGFCLLLFSFRHPVAGDCEKEMNKLSSYYQQHTGAKKMYLQYAAYSVENGKENTKLVSELWVSEKKYKYENKFVTVLQDENAQVSILNDQHLILIKEVAKNKKEKVTLPEANPAAQLDSLKKTASAISCDVQNETHLLMVDLPAQINKKNNLLKRLVLSYGPSGQVKKAQYDYYKSKGSRTDFYEYLKTADTFDESVLGASALSAVLKDGKLIAKYKNFKVKDLRNHIN